MLQRAPIQVLPAGEDQDGTRRDAHPKERLDPAPGPQVLGGEAAELGHQEHGMGPRGRQQVAVASLLAAQVCLGDLGTEEVRGVEDFHYYKQS